MQKLVTKKHMPLTKGFTLAGLTGQACQLLYFNLACVLGLSERYLSTE